MKLHRIGILAHPLRPQTFPVAERIVASLEARGIDHWMYTEWELETVQQQVSDSDMVVAIGGDGAMLKAGQVCAPSAIPLLGINMGWLGFLTEIAKPDDWETRLDQILAGEFWLEKRMMLEVLVMKDERVIASEIALNDAVISGNVFGRMIQMDTYIDGDWATTYNADALIISTPTGSTAYALASGGPILPPDLRNILLTPVAPHLSMDRPIVLSQGAVVDVLPSDYNKNEVVLAVDGNVLTNLKPEHRIHVQASKYISHFVRVRERNYFYRSLLDRLEPRVKRHPPERKHLYKVQND